MMQLENHKNKLNKMEIKKFEFEDMVNVTEMAKPFNTMPSYWMRTDQSKRIINKISHKYICNPEDLTMIVAGGVPKNQGTWMHKDLAEAFNQWLHSKSTKNQEYQTYFIRDTINNYIKIGRSVDTLKRYNTLYNYNPHIEFIFEINMDVEKQLHEQYKDKRKYGEWFNLTDKDIKNIKQQFKNPL